MKEFKISYYYTYKDRVMSVDDLSINKAVLTVNRKSHVTISATHHGQSVILNKNNFF